jgi:hypothetical protein
MTHPIQLFEILYKLEVVVESIDELILWLRCVS